MLKALPPPAANGWILPAALFWALLVSAALQSALLVTGHSLRFSRATLTHVALHNKLVTHLGARPFMDSEGPCLTYEEATLGETAVWKMCRQRPLGFRMPDRLGMEIPTFDLSLFDRADRCPGSSSEVVGSTFRGPVSPADCELPSEVKQSLIIKSNVRGANVSIQGEPSRVVFLATPGRITFESLAVPTGDLLVLAGGDIRIGTIKGQAKSSKVTVLSLAGDITIGAVTGSVSLLPLGRFDVSAPVTPFLPPFPLPPVRSLSVASMCAPVS